MRKRKTGFSASIRTIAIGNRLTFFGGEMDTRQERPAEVGKGDRTKVRTQDNPIGIDDIGLPSGMQKDDVRRLDEIRPDPASQMTDPDHSPHGD
jgi:hypothetical protein